jgi:hypothetical protein
VSREECLPGSVTARLLDQSEADTENARLLRDMIFRRDAELEAKGRAGEKVRTKNTNAA